MATIAGEIDIATVTQLRERLSNLAASGVPLIADLDQVSFIGAAGLGVLVAAARRSTAHGANLRVVCARSQTRRLLRLTKLDHHLALASTVAEALQATAAGEEPTRNFSSCAPALGGGGEACSVQAGRSSL